MNTCFESLYINSVLLRCSTMEKYIGESDAFYISVHETTVWQCINTVLTMYWSCIDSAVLYTSIQCRDTRHTRMYTLLYTNVYRCILLYTPVFSVLTAIVAVVYTVVYTLSCIHLYTPVYMVYRWCTSGVYTSVNTLNTSVCTLWRNTSLPFI